MITHVSNVFQCYLMCSMQRFPNQGRPKVVPHPSMSCESDPLSTGFAFGSGLWGSQCIRATIWTDPWRSWSREGAEIWMEPRQRAGRSILFKQTVGLSEDFHLNGVFKHCIRAAVLILERIEYNRFSIDGNFSSNAAKGNRHLLATPEGLLNLNRRDMLKKDVFENMTYSFLSVFRSYCGSRNVTGMRT